VLHVPIGSNTFGFTQPSVDVRPSGDQGVSVSPATGGYGSWAQLYSSLEDTAYGLLICINSNAASSASRNTVLEVGYDPSGGTNYQTLIPELICGNATNYLLGGVFYYFPLLIPAGSRVAVRGWSTVTTAFRVYAQTLQRPLNPAQLRKGAFVERLGASGRQGTSLSAGTTNEGSWTLLGTTSERLWWWQVGLQVSSSDTSHNNAAYHVDLAVGDESTKDLIITDLQFLTTTAEASNNPPLSAGVEFPCPAGSSIYARAWCSTSTDPLFIKAYGVGG
jgi:hypothetical protein